MPTVKGKQQKQIKRTDSQKINNSVSDIEKDVMSPNVKVKKPIDAEEIDGLIDHEEKLPVDPLLETEETDLELDELGLDDDELDPFNDKWEQ